MLRGLAKLVGLTREKKLASIAILACKRLHETFPHTILFGEGGLGKTALARAVAEELGYVFFEKEAASLKSRNDIVELLIECNRQAKQKQRPFLLFIDEVHQLTGRQQEVFYFPMTERRIDCGDDNWLSLEPFTLFSATTKIHRKDMQLASPRLDIASFINRFPNQWEIRPYHQLHIVEIIRAFMGKHRFAISYANAAYLAGFCKGVPRTAVRMCQQVRMYAAAHNRNQIEKDDIDEILALAA